MENFQPVYLGKAAAVSFDLWNLTLIILGNLIAYLLKVNCPIVKVNKCVCVCVSVTNKLNKNINYQR